MGYRVIKKPRTGTAADIRRWMRKHLESFRVRRTGEIDLAALGEGAAYHFDLLESSGFIPEVIYDVAAEVADSDVEHRRATSYSAAGENVKTAKKSVRFEVTWEDGTTSDLFVDVPANISLKQQNRLYDLAWNEIRDEGMQDHVKELVYVGRN